MRALALIAAVVGFLLVAVGSFELHTTISAWDVLGRSAVAMRLRPDRWRGHFLGWSVAYIALGLMFLFFTIGLWRRSRRAAIAWCATVSILAAVYLALFVLQPFPYGFERVPFGEVAFLIILTAVSWLVVRRCQHAKAT